MSFLLKQEEHYVWSVQDVFKNPFTMARGFLKADYNIDMHVQDFFEINIITGGKGLHYLEKKRVAAKRGDVFIIPPGMSHGYQGGTGFDVYHVLLSPVFMEKHLADLQLLPSFYLLFQAEPLMRQSDAKPLHLTLSNQQQDKIEELLSAITAHSPAQSPENAIMCNSLVVMLITKLCTIHSENTKETTEKAQPDEAFMRALMLIHERYDEKITLDRLAKTAQTSRSLFIRRFQEICQTSPMKYLLKKRLEAAKRMLIGTSLPLAEIAVKTGFYDTAHFTKTFMAEYGKTPGVFRKENT